MTFTSSDFVARLDELNRVGREAVGGFQFVSQETMASAAGSLRRSRLGKTAMSVGELQRVEVMARVAKSDLALVDAATLL